MPLPAALPALLAQCARHSAAQQPGGVAALRALAGLSSSSSSCRAAHDNDTMGVQQQQLHATAAHQQQPAAAHLAQAWRVPPSACSRAFSTTTSTSSSSSLPAVTGAPPPPPASAPGGSQQEAQLDALLQVLLHPMPHASRWNAQLAPYLLGVNDQLLLAPSAVLTSVVRALHVIRGVLQEDGHVYVVESNRQLRPLIKAAAASSLNPNMWWYHRAWSPGMLTNYASSGRLFKEGHQPNRRLFAAKGLRPVNPLCPTPLPAAAPVPRLSWDDKWLLYNRTRQPGYRQLLEELLATEDLLHKFKPAGSLRGTPSALSLMVVLDASRNAVAIREAANRNVPTIAVANTTNDMSQVTYPVLGRDFSPAFIHWFLDWILKVSNAAPNAAAAAAGEPQAQQLQAADR